ncbi:MAG: hypothetical protein ACLFQM_04015 [Fidelibacterota bacterium]
MNKLLKYNFNRFNKKEYVGFLDKIIAQDCDGIILSAFKQNVNRKKFAYTNEYHQSISEMIYMAHDRNLMTALELNLFSSKYLWNHKNFSPPVSSKGAEFPHTEDYYPVCPNNKLSSERIVKLIDAVSNIIPDYFILNEFRFPYDWQNNPLDLQDKIPNYCYCPYCIAEFSSELGIIINNIDTLFNNINAWMTWRFQVLEDYFEFILDKLVAKKDLIVQVPPLNLVDIPFSTGQTLLEYGEKGAKISPLLFHRTKQKDMNWSLEILELFKIDIPEEIIIPSIQHEVGQKTLKLPAALAEYDDVLIY